MSGKARGVFDAGLRAHAEAISALVSHLDKFCEAADMLVECYRNRGKVLLFGNGGSAADAQHIAAELVGKYYLSRPPLPALALTVNTSVLTAVANDYGFDHIFDRQIRAWGCAGDVAIGISTSGKSPNVITAVRRARQQGMRTIGLAGADGGPLLSEVEVCVCVPSSDTPRIQEGHILVGHLLCEFVERELFGSGDA
jgi:D-sedoheptulose 7-phosphate isomerase